MREVNNAVAFDDINEATMHDDPYPLFERLQRQAPVHWYPEIGCYLVTRWDDVYRVANNHDEFGPLVDEATTNTARRAFGGHPTILTADGDQHADLRKAVDQPLRPRAVKRVLAPLVEGVVAEVLEGLRGTERVDLIDAYFEPISVRALAATLGIDGVDDIVLRRWFAGIVAGLLNVEQTEEGYADSDRALAEITEVVTPIIERVTAEPNDTAISQMVHADREGDPRTVDEILPTLTVYIAGGMQEPGHGAGSTMLGLLTEPHELERLKADPPLLIPAVEEGLRWISPIGHIERAPRHDLEIAGVTIPAGTAVFACVSAANRDPGVFDDPNRYIVGRPNTRHQAFGGGRHVCAGNALGRNIIRQSLEQLIAAYPDMRLDPEGEVVVDGWHFRAPRKLPVVLGERRD